ncbi:uncharacterized protein TA11655 [Theileria annulata]|uniref:Uncharacterized protein n=1 Tax=Theileria annulata TaxID=5874 RepID=Q4UDL5_THEAN|nr:uncharacterized protein TA11655 [Theileria annulata]CAI74824.1 hypothetical protein TA11655 [Theileria annulata]|eukprot:XP_952556.1 hypothetical protein TA11655 [Theileria annulata]
MVKNALSDLNKEDEVYRRAKKIKVLINVRNSKIFKVSRFQQKQLIILIKSQDSKYTAKKIINKNEIEFRKLVDHLECVRESLNIKNI